MRVIVWNIDDPGILDPYLSLNLYGICTNRPREIIQYLSGSGMSLRFLLAYERSVGRAIPTRHLLVDFDGGQGRPPHQNKCLQVGRASEPPLPTKKLWITPRQP